MISLLPQVKRLEYKGEAGFSCEGPLLVELSMEQEDLRLERHCRRLLPGAAVTVETGAPGYRIRISRAGGETPCALDTDKEEGAASERKEGYSLRIGVDGAIIRAADAPHLYYGLQTFRQMMEQGNPVPSALIEDWPVTAIRCMNYDLRQTYSKPERLVSYLAEFARFKINAVLIEYEDKFPFETYSHLVHPKHALSRTWFEELKREAEEHYIEIIPLQQCFGHLEYVLRHDRYKHLRETEQSIGELCPSREEAYELVTGLLGEMMDRHPDSRYIHLGCDEVYSLCECETCLERFEGVRERAFIAFLNRLIAFAADRGRIPIFWHDMLAKCPEEELWKLDRRGVAMIWIYNGRNIEAEVSAIADKFRKLGVGVMGAPAVRSFDWAEHQNYPVIGNRTDNLLQWAGTAEKLDFDCVVATNWTGPFSLGVPYGVFETTWYPMLLHADLFWNGSGGVSETFIDRFLHVFHGIEPSTGHAKLGNYRLEDYYDLIPKLLDEVRLNRDFAELIAVMRDYETATDRSRAIHKYVYRWELFPGDAAERRSLLNNYQRNRRDREDVRPRMQAALERYQPADMAAHFVLSRFYLHDYLERTIYREIGMNMED
ncbi:glycoside hydrolase family 20 zincin-like fold domain-containing protein [Paenibacillus agaridevorans]|uniref:glycoside hydrolase family 20 zincin-like fold domain-containing protein n=1 Tax=Paenibacillus agaridevorans TaxID=171404 RepID=UPI001BE481B7|nr:glycoside hydrolase family 20 zincin-like fold domain-containing protein [Paenibacillus agaridevorans]